MWCTCMHTYDVPAVVFVLQFNTLQVCELMIYLALLADWGVLASSPGAWQPVALLFGTATLPIMYSRRIVDFGAKEC